MTSPPSPIPPTTPQSDTSSPPAPAYPRRRLRWAVPPLAAAVLIGGFGLAPTLADTPAPPTLPAISAHDLVAKVISAESMPGFTGTIQTNTDLGLPDLGSFIPQNTSLLSTLIAPHTIQVWYAAGGKLRLAIPDNLAETDVISDGQQLWVWQSSDQTVTHVARATDTVLPGTTPMDLTPSELADKALAAADPNTRVFVRGTATVAGRSSYELVLAPTVSDTLVADTVIDVDADTGLPLRVQVLARDASTPVIDVGFTKLALGAPPASEFTFTPPPGSSFQEASGASDLLFGVAPGRLAGRARLSPGPDGSVPPGSVAVQPGTVTPGKVGPIRRQKVVPGQVPPAKLLPVAGGDVVPVGPSQPTEQVIGSGWDAVAVVNDLPRGLGQQFGTEVSGSWGSGRLITTKLVTALVLPDGRSLVGFVTPERLESLVSQLGPAGSGS